MKTHGHGAPLALTLTIALAAAPGAAAQDAPHGASPDSIPTSSAPNASGAARAAAGPSADFWRGLADPTLERLIGEAIRANPDVEVAGARMGGARAARLGAAFALTPSVTAVGGYSRQQLASAGFPGAVGRLPETDLWDAGVRVAWEVDVFGRLRQSLRGQNALVSAAQEDASDVRVQLAAQVAAAYFDLRGAQDRLAVARRNAENQRGTLDVTLQRLEAGRGTALDSERARAQLSATLAAIPALEASVSAAQYRIGVLAGREPTSLVSMLGPTGSAVTLPEPPVVERPDALARARPDVRGVERRVAASSALVGAARAEYYPRVAIGGTAGYTSSTVGSIGNAGTPRYTVGPMVTWRGLDLGRVRAEVDAARAQELELRARYDQAVLRSREELETSLVAYRKSRERLGHLEESAAASERAAELARLRYTEGASDFLQVLDAERTLLAAQDQRALGRAEATGALVAVYRAMAGADARRGDGR